MPDRTGLVGMETVPLLEEFVLPGCVELGGSLGGLKTGSELFVPSGEVGSPGGFWPPPGDVEFSLSPDQHQTIFSWNRNESYEFAQQHS